MTDDLPELEMPDFDPKRASRAVRRGLFRTTSYVLAVLLVLGLTATVGSSLVQTRGGRGERMMDVLGTAFKLYNPGYQVVSGECCETTPLSMSFKVSAGPLRADSGGREPAVAGTYPISQNFFGRVDHLPLGNSANTRLSVKFYEVGSALAAKEEVRKALARLPADLLAVAVVEFAAPLGADELKGFLEQNEACAEKVVYERRTGSLPITWGDITWDRGPFAEDKEGCGVGLGNFRSWVAMLRDHDDRNLRSFDLSLDRLRKASREGLAYAFVDETSIGKLRKLIEDPRVRTIRLGDVAFDLDRP
ncbi:hypothetical protein SAMN05444920_103848 [Nonomuraea solani]|uniref:Uncharacterized protein n=1 Tax=Nonomuraea solani TaxID=1144553 RepID=A0A1H6C456_9ACTN|nr:hypothetical protein [Nonomuraea solani]SEG67146.1 hypothetical protein SAMN05444920_103848 [Nonomuraea solani]